jgi:protease secretion system membrane fusion protein
MKLLEWFKGNEPEVIGEEEVLHTNMRPVIIFGFAVLIFGFLGFIIWAAFAPMINGVNIQGTVASASHENIIQSRYGGTIQKILVSEGADVKKGQLLILLDDGQLKSNLASVKSRYITYLAMYARLKAEVSGASSLKFPKALLSFKNSAHAKEAVATQQELFYSDMAGYEAQKNIIKVSIESLKNYLKNAEELKRNTLREINIAKKELAPLDKLSKEGYYPKVKVLDLKSRIESLKGRLNSELSDISRYDGSLSENEIKSADLKNNFLKDVNSRLNTVQNGLFASKQQYKSALSQYEHSRIASPVNGVIVKIYNKTIGGAIMPGQPIVDILPLNQNLIVKGFVPVQNIAHVRKGLTANLRFAAFNVEDIPVVNGRVIYVSANSVPNPANHIPFYACKIKIDSGGLKVLAERRLKLKAGMPVEVTVKTGSKTLLGDILDPLLYKVSNAFVK